MEKQALTLDYQSLSTQAQLMVDIDDHSLLIKLRRSCSRIEELMDEVAKLRKENETQRHIIASLQLKERQYLLIIDQLRQSMAITQAEKQQCAGTMTIQGLAHREMVDLSDELRQLASRYDNCEEENTILRRELARQEMDYEKTREGLRMMRVEMDKLEDEKDRLQRQLDVTRCKLDERDKQKRDLEKELRDLMKRQAELERMMGEYGLLNSKLQLQLAGSAKIGETWWAQYQDLSETVEHIEALRDAHRVKKAGKVIQ